MRRLLVLLTMALSLSAGVVLRGDDLVLSRFSDYLDSLRAQAGIPGLAAVLVGSSDITWEGRFGLRDIDRGLPALTDTPFEIDGLTEVLTASLVLRCVEDGSLTLDDRVGKFSPGSPEANSTLREILSHTSPGPNGPVFSYRPERLSALEGAVSVCVGGSFRYSIGALLYPRLAMLNSVPGLDAVGPTAASDFDGPTIARFNDVLTGLAVPYSVDASGRATPSHYSATTLTAGSGLISTGRDLARFDLYLKGGILLRPASLSLAWTPPLDGNGQRLPHGFGWFVQTYNGERIVWQFGVSGNTSSSMMITVPGRGLTLILLANSQGLVRSFPLSAGDITVSPFAKLFLGIFVR